MADTPSYVLDTFALLALVQDEPGAGRVQRLLAGIGAGEVALHMCAMNAAEALDILWRRSDELTARVMIADLGIIGVQFHDATLQLSLQAGALKAQYPMALGDCYAAALAQQLDATLVTGDPEFKQVEDVVKIEWLC